MGFENEMALVQKTEPNKPWAIFPIKLHHSVKSFFSVAIVSEVGNGRNTLFWTDNWVHGQNLQKLVPHLFEAIFVRARKRIVREAVSDLRWVSDIWGALTVNVLAEFLGVWNLIAHLVLQPEVEDIHIWRFSPCSLEQFILDHGKGYGKLGPQASVNSSCGWLHMTGAGRLISWPGKDYLTLQNAPM